MNIFFGVKFVCAKKIFCVKILLGENLLGEHFLSKQKMYGFWGVGQLDVRFGRMSP